MGSGGIQNPSRQMGGNVSFAQSLSGSQPATPLDPSYVLSTLLRLRCFPGCRFALTSLVTPYLHTAYACLHEPTPCLLAV